METMTKLEREQAQKLIDLDCELEHQFNRMNDVQDIVAQLRDELATMQQRAERAEAKLLEVANDARTLAISNVSCRQERDELKAKLEHPPQPQGEVLFEGVRYVMPMGVRNIEAGAIASVNYYHVKDTNLTIPVHVTIRKAGE